MSAESNEWWERRVNGEYDHLRPKPPDGLRVSAVPSLFCVCGQPLDLHNIEHKGAPRDDGTCSGFRLEFLRWYIWHQVDTPYVEA